ncbi:DUF1822 family protein [Nostoc sp. UHCC 0702]|nr:DUF1822 family protein [Nostoc sp. UHCC 0702]
MYSLSDATNDFFEINQTGEIINLESEYFTQALLTSQNYPVQSKQWQIYLQFLAFLAVNEWLEKREPTFSINQAEFLAWQSQYTYVNDTAFNVSLGNFKVCIIPVISISQEEVTVCEEVVVPRAMIDLPEFNSHFYIVIGIEEEIEVATIKGFLRYDELVEYKPELQPELDWNYHLPLTWFHNDCHELLLDLQCLSPTAITLPEIPSDRQNILATIQSELLNLLPQLHHRPLWQVLTWEQGIALLTTPDLLNWLYQSLQENTPASTKHLSDLLQILTQQAVNVRAWLNNQIDEVIQGLTWQVLAPPSPLLATTQTPEQELDNILTNIQSAYEINIPEFAGRAYREFSLENRLRLYAVTWQLPEENQSWSLLLILKTVSSNQPTSTFTLRVSDQTSILAEEQLQPSQQQQYIFTLLEGSYHDKFLAKIISSNGQIQTLPPLEFSRK